ncbi:winged helix-turn-helix domain-containing protein [Luminiphilus sp.]|jgi:two-component system OmpR family response regulator|nr:winged helix-turn-helix domain-containing protein [Luminiphilus sp.]MDA8814606.1 winged helix-turn-helix domain-containing protein [Luminiphilus sp.]MDA9836603.1 winged helix-turn-helix domain-containing protein [Luminiphilus sp.]
MSQLTGRPSALLVVSDGFLAKQLTDALHIQGYKTVRAGLARDCYSAWSSPERFSFCIIDQHLADQPGHVLAKYLAENKAKNVVLFGNLADAEMRMSLYRSGVKLLLREPDGTAEIMAAIDAIDSPQQVVESKPATVVPFPKKSPGHAPWQVKALQRELVAPEGQSVALTRNEVKVCLALAESPTEPTNREALTRSLYGRFDASANRALDAVIKRLRQKIVARVSAVDPITTHYGEGHRFTAPIITVNQ